MERRKKRSFTPEFRAEAVRNLFMEHSQRPTHPLRTSRQTGCTPQGSLMSSERIGDR